MREVWAIGRAAHSARSKGVSLCVMVGLSVPGSGYLAGSVRVTPGVTAQR